VWVALWLSLVGALACLAIVVAGGFRKRSGAVISPAIASRPTFLEAPLARHSRRTIVAVAILTVAAGVLVRPWVGLLVGALAFWSVRDRRVRVAVRYAPAAIVGAIAVYMAAAQAIEHYVTGTHWPAIFKVARIPMWIALFLLLADALVERMWSRDDVPAPEASADDA
jgi:hypothetical protein